MKNIQAIVLDLYGTLIYLGNPTNPYKKLLAEIGLQTSEEFKQAYKIALTEDFDNLADFVKRIKPDCPIDLKPYQEEIEKGVSSAVLYPETKDFLDELRKKDLKLGLISNLAFPFKKPFFELGLDKYFDNVLFSCEIGLIKPDPNLYQRMIDLFSIDASQILMVGDNLYADFNGPKAIGINAILLDRTSGSPNSISNLTKALQYIK